MDFKGTEKEIFDDENTKAFILQHVKYIAIEIHDKEIVYQRINTFTKKITLKFLIILIVLSQPIAT